MVRVSIIIPCYNEVGTIAQVLEALRAQTHPLTDLEVIVVDGMSNDGTRQAIQAFAAAHREMAVRMIDNPKRVIPAALNSGIEAANGNVIIRLDAHALPYPDYVERSLHALEVTGAANAGGVWEIRPSAGAWLARAIAAAASHPLGAGDARYRTAGRAGPADTVPFGAFRREWLDRVGSFDESLLSNEDYDLNVRLRRAGGLVWLDPSIRSVYFARATLSSLARQYARYGFWKTRMLARNVDTLRWRQVLPPLFIAAAVCLTLAGLAWQPAWLVLAVQLIVYTLITIAAGLAEGFARRDMGVALGFSMAIWTMHLSWGSGFVWGLLTWLVGGRRGRNGA